MRLRVLPDPEAHFTPKYDAFLHPEITGHAAQSSLAYVPQIFAYADTTYPDRTNLNRIAGSKRRNGLGNASQHRRSDNCRAELGR